MFFNARLDGSFWLLGILLLLLRSHFYTFLCCHLFLHVGLCRYSYMQLSHGLRVEESLEGFQKRGLEISCPYCLPVEHCERRTLLSVLFWDNIVFFRLMNLPAMNIVFLWICLANTCFWFPCQSCLLGVFKRDIEGELLALHLCSLLFFPANEHWYPFLVDWFHALHSLRKASRHILVVYLHPPIHIAAEAIHILPVVVGILSQRWDSQWSWW